MYSFVVVVYALCLWFDMIKVVKSTTIHTAFQMIEQENKLLGVLQQYFDLEEARISSLEKHRDTVTERIESYSSEDEFAFNPLAIYKTVKYLTVDHKDVEKNMKANSYDDFVKITFQENEITLPDENGLYNEVRNLVHLQRALNLIVADVVDGRLTSDTTIEPALTADDCLYIGKTCAEKGDHETAVKWLKGCWNRFDNFTQGQEAATLLIPSSLCIGDKTLTREATNVRIQKYKADRALWDLIIKLSLDLGNWQNVVESDQWESFNVCAGKYDGQMVYQNLKCWYNHHNSPFLTIAPLKEEILSLTPKISIFREVVYDSEIELMKTEAFDLLRSARVSSDAGNVVDRNYRPSLTAFLQNLKPEFANLRHRLEDLSTLSLKEAEGFQMLNYAPGGFYRVHSDFLPPEIENVKLYGNRIASALMYLNDAMLGGNTVFPRLRLNVHPVKGSVLFWTNMKGDGSVDELTKHAACPVIYGEKIACTQWFRTKGQDHWITNAADPDGPSLTKYIHRKVAT